MTDENAPAEIQSNIGRDRGKESCVTVAAVQMKPAVGCKDENARAITDLLEKAVDQGADLIVLPELCTSAYVFNTRAEVGDEAESVPEGPTVRAWCDYAVAKKVHIVAGIAEREGHALYNAAVVLGPQGYIGKYRKLHLWDEEKLFFEPGNLGCPVFCLPFGRIGVLICYDAWHPEVPRILALKGADIVCAPAAWVAGSKTEEASAKTPIHPYVHAVHAHVNSICFVCADRIGYERGTTFLGRSCIAGTGGFIAGPASADEPEIVLAEINVVRSRYKQWTPLANPLADRRVDVYDRLLGYKEPLGR